MRIKALKQGKQGNPGKHSPLNIYKMLEKL
jgi:hypothetical protein